MMNPIAFSKLVRGNNGFSMVELVVVIGIITVGLAVGIPAYNSTIRPTAELKAAARQVFSDIQWAKLEAIKANRRHGLAFYQSPDRYIVFIDNNVDGQRNGGDVDLKAIDFTQEFGAVRFDTSCASCGGDGITFTNDAVTMTSRSVASSSGSVFLKNQKNEGRMVLVNQMGGVRMGVYNP